AHALVGDGARIAVAACGAVGRDRVGARAARGIARAGDMALIARAANNRVPAAARARLARIGLRARVAVVTRAPVGRGRIGARAGRGIAHAGEVALVGGGAGHVRDRHAGARLAGLGEVAEISVVAQRAVGLPGALVLTDEA